MTRIDWEKAFGQGACALLIVAALALAVVFVAVAWRDPVGTAAALLPPALAAALFLLFVAPFALAQWLKARRKGASK